MWTIPIMIIVGCLLLGRPWGVRIIAIVIALGCLLVGWMAASLGNRNDRVGARILLGYGAITSALVALSFAFPWGGAILEWFLIVTIGLTIIAYSLPQSFWRLRGPRKSP